jgi:hypothetical protein
MSVKLFHWYAYRSKQDKKGTLVSNHKPQGGIYFFPIKAEEKSDDAWMGGSVEGYRITENCFAGHDTYAGDAFEGNPLVLTTFKSEDIWELVKHSTIKRLLPWDPNFFDVRLIKMAVETFKEFKKNNW